MSPRSDGGSQRQVNYGGVCDRALQGALPDAEQLGDVMLRLPDRSGSAGRVDLRVTPRRLGRSLRTDREERT
jgi:hypothetical protein